MTDRDGTYRSFKMALILVGLFITVPALSSVIMSMTAGNADNVWTPLQPVLSVTLLFGILVWVLSPFAAMITFYALGTRAALGILAGFGIGTLMAVLLFLLMAGVDMIFKRP